jgi:hypothetical protein
MQKKQFDHWVHADIKDHHPIPKIFVISCAESTCYQLAVEYKHRLEPIMNDGEVMKFTSIELVKESLVKMGVDSAYLRLHNAYDEFGPSPVDPFHDIKLSLVSH